MGDVLGPADSPERDRPGEGVAEVVRASGYLAALEAEAASSPAGRVEAGGRIENLEELESVAARYGDLVGFLETTALVAATDDLAEADGRVALMTLHAAKGLEFRAVFLTGMEEGIFPHDRALSEPDDLEEERRLCYVGITRARERLYLTHTWVRTVFGMTRDSLASRFLREIPDELVEDVADPPAGYRRFGAGMAGGSGAGLPAPPADELVGRPWGRGPPAAGGAVGALVRRRLGRGVLGGLDQGAGAAFGFVRGVFVVWLIGALVGLLPIAPRATEARQSLIIRPPQPRLCPADPGVHPGGGARRGGRGRPGVEHRPGAHRRPGPVRPEQPPGQRPRRRAGAGRRHRHPAGRAGPGPERLPGQHRGAEPGQGRLPGGAHLGVVTP